MKPKTRVRKIAALLCITTATLVLAATLFVLFDSGSAVHPFINFPYKIPFMSGTFMDEFESKNRDIYKHREEVMAGDHASRFLVKRRVVRDEVGAFEQLEVAHRLDTIGRHL